MWDYIIKGTKMSCQNTKTLLLNNRNQLKMGANEIRFKLL